MSGRIHDLSYPIHDGMSTYPASYHPPVEVRQMGRIEVDGRASRRVVMGTHSGTHIDAPSHFILGGAGVDRIEPQRLVGPATMLRFPDQPPGTEIDAAALRDRLSTDRPERVILRFDWSRRWDSAEFYTRYPYLSEDACHFLLDSGVRLIGSDSPSPDDPKKSGPRCVPDSPNHKLLLGSGVILVEYLRGLEAIRSDVVQLIALPLRIRDGDGAPARVLAIEP